MVGIPSHEHLPVRQLEVGEVKSGGNGAANEGKAATTAQFGAKPASCRYDCLKIFSGLWMPAQHSSLITARIWKHVNAECITIIKVP